MPDDTLLPDDMLLLGMLLTGDVLLLDWTLPEPEETGDVGVEMDETDDTEVVPEELLDDIEEAVGVESTDDEPEPDELTVDGTLEIEPVGLLDTLLDRLLEEPATELGEGLTPELPEDGLDCTLLLD